jgi:hypothetical protein
VPTADGCELTYTNNPRVRVSDLFKKGSPSATPVAFLAGSGANGRSYEIRMLDAVPMALDDANTRTLTHAGQAYLFEFGNGKAKAVEAPFRPAVPHDLRADSTVTNRRRQVRSELREFRHARAGRRGHFTLTSGRAEVEQQRQGARLNPRSAAQLTTT